MKLTADTHLLVRAMTGDHPQQSGLARAALAKAEMVVVTLPALCELVWVLARGYKILPADIASAIRLLAASGNVVVNRPAIEAGLAMLEAGGDFADGIIAYDGYWLGAEAFVSFDRKAVALMQSQGQPARLLE